MPGTRHAMFAVSSFTSLQRSCNWPCCEVLFIVYSAYTSVAPSSSLLPNSPLLCPLWACLCNSLSGKDLVLLAPLEHCHLCPRHADSDLLSSERLYRFRSVETLRAVSNITTPLLTLSSCSKYFPYLKEYVSLAPDRYQGPTCCAFLCTFVSEPDGC